MRHDNQDWNPKQQIDNRNVKTSWKQAHVERTNTFQTHVYEISIPKLHTGDELSHHREPGQAETITLAGWIQEEQTLMSEDKYYIWGGWCAVFFGIRATSDIGGASRGRGCILRSV